MTETGVKEIKETYGEPGVAEGYRRARFESEPHRLLHERQVQMIQRALDRVRPERVLEIAAGPGRLTQDLRVSCLLVCIEFNEGMIEIGRQACGDEVIWARGDGFALPFGESFDLVYSFRFVRHFEVEQRARLYAEFRRVLRPGGVFLMDAVNGVVSEPLRKRNPKDYPIYDMLYKGVEELEQELRDNGFELIETTPVQRRFALQHRIQCLVAPRSRRLASELIRAIERVGAGPGLEWIVTCRRA